MKRYFTIIFLILISFLLSCARMDYAEKQLGYRYIKHPLIKVRIYEGTGGITVGAHANYILRTWNKNGENSSYFSASPLKVKTKKGLLYLYDQNGNILEQDLHKVLMIPKKEKRWLWINKRDFHGIFELYPNTDNSFYVVNVLNIEDYLKGVLPPEIGDRKKEEFDALKAQAVAARTYALSMTDKYPDKQYDLINDIRDQVYTGIRGETKQANKAVKQTKGEVITYHGELIEAYYHSTCSGRTDNIEEIWDREPVPYLRSVKDYDFCRWSKFFDWNELFPAEELLEHIKDYLRSKGRDTDKVGTILKEITIVDRTTAGRVKSLKVSTDKGTIHLYKDQIRWAFGRHGCQGILPSTYIEIDLQKNPNGIISKVHVTGYGFGHGIGMCQCGAIGMARYGFDYKKILKNYYSGVSIEKLY